MAKNIKIKVFNSPPTHPAFGWYHIDSVHKTEAAIIDINVAAILGAVKDKAIPKKDVPYFLSRIVMHEVVHAFEDWAKVEFNHRKIAALLKVLDRTPKKKKRHHV